MEHILKDVLLLQFLIIIFKTLTAIFNQELWTKGPA